MTPMSTATAPVNFDHWLPEGQSLFDFQHVGVAYALFQTRNGLGTFIADEQGLGKTRQAIVTAKVAAAIRQTTPKVLIVCKSALKGNWERELRTCAPEWNVQVLAGRRPYELTDDIAIISFDLLAPWADALVEEGFNTLIIDESHMVKDTGAQRTKAAIKVAADVRARLGTVLLLTGTPILNRPVELVAQLQIIGRLEQVAPQPKGRANPTLKDWVASFKNTFCWSGTTQWGTEYKGARYLDLLNTRLTSNCMIRRLRQLVLNLDETHRVEVPLSLNGDLKSYWNLEKTFQAVDERSYWIELLGALRQEVAHCKIPATVEWVKDFVEENPGKKLVIWAWHIPTQVEVAKALNEAGIETVLLRNGAGNSKKLEAIKADFNEGSAQVIVCSLRAHAEGHTLVGDGLNVTDCLFVEQPWHGGNVAQAEDRINRIGRQAAAVFAHTLIVPGTVDEWLADLIGSKRATTKTAIDGTEVTAAKVDTQKQLLLKLQAHMVAKYGEARFPTLTVPTDDIDGDVEAP